MTVMDTTALQEIMAAIAMGKQQPAATPPMRGPSSVWGMPVPKPQAQTRGPLAAPPQPTASSPPAMQAPSPAFEEAFAGLGAPSPVAAPPRPAAPVSVNQGPLAIPDAGPVSPVAAPSGAPRRGVFDRIGDFIGSDRGKGALFRAGASMLSSGDIGAGMMAGANYVDDQKAIEAGVARDQRDYELAERRVDAGILDAAEGRRLQGQDQMLDMLKLQEAIRKARAGEELDAVELQLLQAYRSAQLGVQMRGQDVTAETQRRGQDVSAETARRGQDISSADSRYRTNTGMIDDGQTDTYTYELDENGNRIGSTRTRSSAGQPIPIVSQQEYDSLPSGARYIDTYGRLGVKP